MTDSQADLYRLSRLDFQNGLRVSRHQNNRISRSTDENIFAFVCDSFDALFIYLIAQLHELFMAAYIIYQSGSKDLHRPVCQIFIWWHIQ